MLLLAMLPLGAVLLYAPDRTGLEPVATAAMAAGLVAGVLLLVSALLAYVQWRTATDPRQGWVVAAVVLISGQVFVNAGLLLDSRHAASVQGGWPLLHEATTTLVILCLCVTALRTKASRMPDPLLIGIGLSVVAIGVRVAGLSIEPGLAGVALYFVTVAIALGHLAIGVVVMRNQRLPRWASWRLAATVALIGLSYVATMFRPEGDVAGLATAAVLSVAGILWASATCELLRGTLDAQRLRAASLEGSLFEIEMASRSTNERMHEVRSIVAGLSSATRLLDGQDLPEDLRARLERTIHSELGRLERVVTMTPTQPGTVDLDEVLDAILHLHRARGRTIEWEPSGVRVLGCLDAVAETVNILLENAAAHGGDTGSRIAVQSDPLDDVVHIRVSDDGPGIPAEIRPHVFDWGVGRSGSPGQGIGLNLAQRLMTEQGGTITLDEPTVQGSSFVIRLPAARRSEEDIHDSTRV